MDEVRNRIKVSIIDDDKFSRDYLKDLLLLDERIRVYGEYFEANQFMTELENSPFLPDVCLIDIYLADNVSGIDCAKKIKEMYPDIHIILMTANATPKTIAEASKINADYIEKGTIGEALINKIITEKEVKTKGRIVSFDSKADYLKKGYPLLRKLEEIQNNVKELSDNQKLVIKLKRQQKKSLPEIAEIMKIEETTVRSHLERASKKLNLPDLIDYLDLD